METSTHGGDDRPSRGIRAILRFPLVTLGMWIVLGAVGMVFLPSVGHVVEGQSNANLPADSPTLTALTTMDKAFGSGRSRAFVFVVLENKATLSDKDDAAYADIVARLKTRPDYVSEVQDYLGDADKKAALVSHDAKATYLPVGLTADLGSAVSNDQVAWVRGQVSAAAKETRADATATVTGDPANLVDITKLATDANEKAGIFSMALLFVILLLIYRRVVSVFIPLVTIGIAALCTMSVLSLAGQAGMGLSTYTQSFCLAIVLGAGTDYSIFLISRFREEYARTGEVRPAVGAAVSKIGGALLASAGTVAVSSLVLLFAKLSVFSTTGPAMAVAVGTTVVIALTVTPALLLLFGTRIGPARPPTAHSFWSRVGAYVANRPTRILLVGTAVLVLFAAFAPTVRLGYAEKPADPTATESARGGTALDDHFGAYTTQPNYALVVADHDMRNSRDLAVLAAASRDVAKIGGVTKVSSAAQPAGTAIKDSKITSQIGKVADELGTAADKIQKGRSGLTDLKTGSSSLASGADQQAAGLRRAAGALPRVISGMNQLAAGSTRSANGTDRIGAAALKIRTGIRDLANGLDQVRSGASRSTSGIGQVIAALNQDPYCNQSPICPQARASLSQIYNNQKNKLVPGLASSAAGAARLANGQNRISDGLRDLASGLRRTASGQRQVAGGQQSLASGLNRLASGSQQLADGLDALPPGIGKVVDSTLKLSAGLGRTSGYLDTVSKQSNTAEAGGFYLPSSALDSEKFSVAVKQFLSADGKVARIQVLGGSNPGSNAGVDRYNATRDRVEEALDGTTLDGSQVLMTGAAGGSSDLRDYFHQDFKLVLIAVLLTVLLLMMVVLRSLVAPVYLMVSVILSFGAAFGVTVLLFQDLLGQSVPFTVPVLSFVLLVAVGADYNILLMSRMRESRQRLTPGAVGHAVTATGPVITSAGIIFACAFAPMVFSTLSAVAQLAFAVVLGLLLDTFVVRTLIVPACAVLLGDTSWWPSRQGQDEASAV